ncbi:GNAT family N-acetyltransferase [Streptomyces sp. NPDC101132]|uniref:GNAT family N-acetyltransferase n=1 Tax=Streptomyces sp. NPDC101132 TaxID=3366110 RepID=UPI0038227E3B
MTVLIRDLRSDDPADAEAVVRVRRAALPFMIASPALVAFEAVCHPPEARFRVLVAELDGRVVGTAQAGFAYDSPEPGRAFVNPYVDPAFRGRGAGTALLRAGEEYLTEAGASALFSWVLDEPAHTAYAVRRGYERRRSAHFLRLDLTAGLPERATPPAGVELVPASAFADDPRPLYEADAEATGDEPGDIGTEMSDYEDWLATVWADPTLDRELTVAAVVDGQVVAFSAARTDGVDRYGTAMTGTRRAYRGRGLAKLAKNASLHLAREAGYREAFTGNDAENGPMLAINRWFGYEVCATEARYVKEVGGS